MSFFNRSSSKSANSESYEAKLKQPLDVIRDLGSIDNLILAMGVAMPEVLLQAMSVVLPQEHRKPLNIYYMHGNQALRDLLLMEGMQARVNPRPLFLSSSDREVLRKFPQWMQYVPSTFHQVGRILTEEISPDCFMVTVSPMDKHGYFSLGTNADYGASVVRKASKVILEVNPNMPRTFGECSIHISEIDALVESSQPLHEIQEKPISDLDTLIATYISERINDGDTLQLGIGSLPNAVANQLSNHKNLGLHSELFSPAIARLIEQGVINGKLKSWQQHKHVFTLALGDRRMFDFMDDNPSIVGLPASWVNNPSIIRKNDNMVSVNSAIEVDLSGQINAETINGSPFSGTGGQLDFVRGAFASKGGRSFIALHSTAKSGTLSRIVPKLEQGVVTDTRMDTQYVVTEYGCVNLKGLSLNERANALIELAHPDFREALASQAHKVGH